MSYEEGMNVCMPIGFRRPCSLMRKNNSDAKQKCFHVQGIQCLCHIIAGATR